MKSVTIAGRAKPLPGGPHGRGEVCVRGGLRETPASEVEETVLSKIHILGIAGTFMGGVAALARELDHEVEGSDQAVYPPMSTQLETLGIGLKQGYLPDIIDADIDRVVVGNALSPGRAEVRPVLDAGLALTSGGPGAPGHVLERGRGWG